MRESMEEEFRRWNSLTPEERQRETEEFNQEQRADEERVLRMEEEKRRIAKQN